MGLMKNLGQMDLETKQSLLELLKESANSDLLSAPQKDFINKSLIVTLQKTMEVEVPKQYL